MNVETYSATTTRRAFLSTLPLTAAALSSIRLSAEETKPAAESFRFFQLNDLHYLSDDCGRWFRAMIAQMKASEPDAKFALMCGDLANDGDRYALDAVKDVFGTLGVPFHVVPGNHDYTDKESREHYDAVFPGKLNYHFEHGGWQFIGIDTTMGTNYKDTTIAESTLAWIDDAIAKLDAKKPTIAFTHFPLATGVTMTPLNAAAVVERLLKLQLVASFSGHWHGLSEVKHGVSLMATSRCCARVRANADGSPQKGWWVCEAKGDGTLTRRFVEFKAPDDVPVPDSGKLQAKPKPKPAPRKPKPEAPAN